MRQLSLFKTQIQNFHGGSLTKGHRKTRRPLAQKKPIHFVMKSHRNLLKLSPVLNNSIHRHSSHFGLRIYKVAVAHDHVHFVAKIPDRRAYVAFIRALAGTLARKIGKGLWKFLPFSRVATWGIEFKVLMDYLQKNIEEALELRPYEPRSNRYSRFYSPG